MSGRLFDFGSGKLIRPRDVPREPPGGEPPDDGKGDLDRRVTRLEVEQGHLASKADIEGLKSWLSDKLEANQHWFTDRLERQQRWFTEKLLAMHWRLVGFILSGVALLLTIFGFVIRFLLTPASPSG